MARHSRRQFLEDSLFATAAALAAGPALTAFADEPAQSKSANERLSVACIGVRGRGGAHLGAFAGRQDTEVTYVCDADETIGRNRAAETAKRQGREPKYVADMREVFDDPSVDIVTTATPNHWHSLTGIWAMQAGKDVYVEKPVSHNVSEGRRMVEAARKHNRICQTGTQSRSNPGMRELMAYIHAGKIGEVKLARGLCYNRRGSIGPKGEYAAPAGIDYNLWLGPAQKRPVTREQFHYDWHWQWDYGNGDLGNQGIHQMDLARWGLGLDAVSNAVLSYGGRFGYDDAGETANTQVCMYEYGDKTIVFEVRGLPTEPMKGANVGVIYYGSEGYLVVPAYDGGTAFDAQGNPIQTFKGGGDDYHYSNFLAAVRSRKHEELNAEILDGHLSSALCHLGNVSYRLGGTVPFAEARDKLAGNPETLDAFDRFSKHLVENAVDADSTPLRFGRRLAIDPAKEVFPEDSEANTLLTREYRAPFVVPAAV